ncbi:hypothetical protein BCR44DRAFT_1422549 [Catenaria anguillulae PL171]|uniref:Uncharacterized protein n=1 Tax=Catenaria anguillulae PL171 TaxID=765915 RepID=A0A1Y2I360_9FUNG|nr:hypothetical protein BCR44DRAFT_1422549 [Catenaria anguillulae PL171]
MCASSQESACNPSADAPAPPPRLTGVVAPDDIPTTSLPSTSASASSSRISLTSPTSTADSALSAAAASSPNNFFSGNRGRPLRSRFARSLAHLFAKCLTSNRLNVCHLLLQIRPLGVAPANQGGAWAARLFRDLAGTERGSARRRWLVENGPRTQRALWLRSGLRPGFFLPVLAAAPWSLSISSLPLCDPAPSASSCMLCILCIPAPPAACMRMCWSYSSSSCSSIPLSLARWRTAAAVSVCSCLPSAALKTTVKCWTMVATLARSDSAILPGCSELVSRRYSNRARAESWSMSMMADTGEEGMPEAVSGAGVSPTAAMAAAETAAAGEVDDDEVDVEADDGFEDEGMGGAPKTRWVLEAVLAVAPAPWGGCLVGVFIVIQSTGSWKLCSQGLG